MNNMAVVAFRFCPLPFAFLCVHVSCLCTSNIMALKFLLRVPSSRINLLATRSEKTTLNFQDLYIKTMKNAPIKRNMQVPMREYPSSLFSKKKNICPFFYPQIKGEWWYKFRVLPQVYPFHLIQCNFISLTTNSQAKVLQQPLGCDSVTGVDRCERCPQNLNLWDGNHPADVCWYCY